MATEPLKTVITQGTKLSVAVAGPQGPAGPTGPAGGVTSVAGKTGPVTLVSADISDATSAATANTVVKRNASNETTFKSLILDGSVDAQSGVIRFFGDNSGSTELLRPVSLDTGDYFALLPFASGTIPVVPEYADETAANSALASGDFYWDTTLKKLRVATAEP